MKIKQQFCRKLYEELESYKRREFSKGSKCFDDGKIEIFSLLYDILVASADAFSEALLLYLLNESTCILESVYEEIKDSSDSDIYNSVKSHVEKTAECIKAEEEKDKEIFEWWDILTYGEGGY